MGYWNNPLPEVEAKLLSQQFGKTIKYKCPATIVHWDHKYKKQVTVPKGYYSDGATGACDIDSRAWWVHDKLCDYGTFDDGTKCTNWQASMILRRILWDEGFWIRAFTWRPMTHLFGGGKARENGMFTLDD